MGLICCISTKILNNYAICAQSANSCQNLPFNNVFLEKKNCVGDPQHNKRFSVHFNCILNRKCLQWNNSIVSFYSSYAAIYVISRVYKMQNNEHLSITKWRRLISFLSYSILFHWFPCASFARRIVHDSSSLGLWVCVCVSVFFLLILINLMNKAETNFLKVWCCSCCAAITDHYAMFVLNSSNRNAIISK